MPSNWCKQPQQLSAAGGGFLNGGAGDEVVGGLLTGVPAGLNISQGIQTLPGDRMVLGEEDALALSDLSIGQLYGGLYQYVTSSPDAVAEALKNCAAFWDTTVPNDSFQVTPDEDGAQGVALFAGVYINDLDKGNSWWIQQAGTVLVKFRAVLTGTPADGCPTFLAAAGAGASNGTFDVMDDGDLNDQLIPQRYTGPAIGAPVADTVSTICIPLSRCFRW